MTAPTDLRYTRTHEWLRQEGDLATIGITDHAQTELGDITYLELPEVGDEVSFAKPFGIVESVKTASDLYAPIDGEVVERNEEAIASPDLINTSPYEKAWLVKIRLNDPSQVAAMMAPAEYDQFADAASSH